MADQFNYDVFLSLRSQDKAIVRPLAERLRADGLRVWFDEWVLKPGDSIPAKIEEGLEQSRVLVLCMSAQAFGSEWAQLERYTFRFRDPLNKERRFVPLRLDAAPIKGSLAQFLYINWLPEMQEQGYSKVLEACRPSLELPEAAEIVQSQADRESLGQGKLLRFPGNKSTLHKLDTVKYAKQSRKGMTQVTTQASAKAGSVFIAIAGSNQGNISIRMPAQKSSNSKYPANSIGADANMTNYIEYLCDLYVKFMRPSEADENKSWAKIGTHIKNKFRLRKRTRSHLSAERFPDLVDYLINEKLTQTPVGKKPLRNGTKLCRTFEEFRYGKM